MTIHHQPRERWATRGGFILAAVGSAAGLGNIWRFPYVAGEQGGAAFMLVYIACVLLIGIPIVIAEAAVGRATQRDPVAAFRAFAPAQPWAGIGVLGTATVSLVLAFYGVVAGWTARFLFLALTGGFARPPDGGFGADFGSFVASPLQPLLWQAVMMAVTVAVVAGGVRGGIERCNRVLMPLLGAIVVGLAAFSLTREGAGAGLRFFLAPDWGALMHAEIYLAAMGQAFFSLGVGACVFVAYGSYLRRRDGLVRSAGAIATGDTLIALLAGLAIFPAVFAFGLDPAAGPPLAFVTLPSLFAIMPGGSVAGVLFFLLLAAAALTSMLSMLELPVAWLTRRTGWSRRKAGMMAGGAIYLCGIPASLGFGPWNAVAVGGRDILGMMDYAASNVALPLGGLLIALFVGWRWGARRAMLAAGMRSRGLGRIWLWLLRVVAPAAIILIFLRAVGMV